MSLGVVPSDGGAASATDEQTTVSKGEDKGVLDSLLDLVSSAPDAAKKTGSADPAPVLKTVKDTVTNVTWSWKLALALAAMAYFSAPRGRR